MNILIIDTETTGLTDKDLVIEGGWVVYDAVNKVVKGSASTFFKCSENNAYEHNKIMPEYTHDCHSNLVDFFNSAAKSFEFDYVMAHNAEFDKGFLDRAGIDFGKPWICSYKDIDWGVPDSKLVLIAVSLGVPVVNAHRAVDDCVLLANCLSAVDDTKYLIEDAIKPKITVYANVSYQERGLAKNNGFKWNAQNRRWEKRVIEGASLDFPFSVSRI